jgi:lipopolysaccharide transport system ATP-binding protein
MSQTVIEVKDLGKRYLIGRRERYLALRDVLSNVLQNPFRRRPSPNYIWALKDVSFEVRRGEVLGLIGRNGAGKTTLLKILARVTRPTTGQAEIHGRVGSLLEVGTGFHPELTGRENVYLSGAILGMTKREIESKFDAIVTFSEVARFLDTPLKHYSSGMQMRLAFAVAAHLDPEILLVDEVLAVGDLEFQKKCLGKMEEVSHSGRTIIFISHQMNQIRRLCERVLWIDAGQIREEGATARLVGAYESAMARGLSIAPTMAGMKARFLSWEITDPCEEGPHVLSTLGPVTLKFSLEVAESVQDGHHGVTLFNSERQMIWGAAANNLQLAPGAHEFVYELSGLPIKPGVYTWMVSLWEEGERLDLWNCLPEMLVATRPLAHPSDEWAGILNIPYQFSTEPGDFRAPETNVSQRGARS